jgi:hypothetical protein
MTEQLARQVRSVPLEPQRRSGAGSAWQPAARDPLRDEAWFAEQIGKSADWCRKNRAELPHHVVGESVRYDDHCVDLYREQTFHPAADPMLRSAGSRGMASRRR